MSTAVHRRAWRVQERTAGNVLRHTSQADERSVRRCAQQRRRIDDFGDTGRAITPRAGAPPQPQPKKGGHDRALTFLDQGSPTMQARPVIMGAQVGELFMPPHRLLLA